MPSSLNPFTFLNRDFVLVNITEWDLRGLHASERRAGSHEYFSTCHLKYTQKFTTVHDGIMHHCVTTYLKRRKNTFWWEKGHFLCNMPLYTQRNWCSKGKQLGAAFIWVISLDCSSQTGCGFPAGLGLGCQRQASHLSARTVQIWGVNDNSCTE